MNDYMEYLKLIFVTNRLNRDPQEYLRLIFDCAISGVTCVQLREKNRVDNDTFPFFRELQNLLTPLKIPLIVNDNVDLCLQLNAAGLHLGQKDGNVKEARKQLGSDKIIGLSIETEEQLQIANNLPRGCINYIGIGAVFPSSTKPEADIVGIHELSKLVRLSHYPVVAIGGITTKNIIPVMQTGVQGIAAIRAFHQMQYQKEMTRYWRSVIDIHLKSYLIK